MSEELNMTEQEYTLCQCPTEQDAMEFALILANNLTKFGEGKYNPSIRKDEDGQWIPVATREEKND